MTTHSRLLTNCSRFLAVAVLLAAVASPAAEDGTQPPKHSDTKRYVFTKDGPREIVDTPARAARRAANKAKRRAARAAAREKAGAKDTAGIAKDAADKTADKSKDAAKPANDGAK